MSVETEWPATAKAQLIAPPPQELPTVRSVSVLLALLSAAVLLALRDALRPGTIASTSIASLSIAAMVLAVSVRRRTRLALAKFGQHASELRQALETAEENLRHKDTFVSWASREIRGPLTAIFGACDAAWDAQSTDENRQTLRRNAAQILAVADNMAGVAAHSVLAAHSAVAQPPAPPTPHLTGRVLVAEDGPDNRKVIEFYLEKAGIQFDTVTDGQAACEQAMAAAKRRQPYDLILMDVQMPVADGCAATILLRDHNYRAPIVAITANATERDRTRCLAAGYNGFLAKPIDVHKLAEILTRYLRPAAGGGQTASNVVAQALAAPDPRFGALKDAFVGEIATRISAIEKAIATEDLTAAAELSHQLKGTAGCYGMPEISQAAGCLQTAAESAAHGSDLHESFTTLKELCQNVTPAQAA